MRTARQTRLRVLAFLLLPLVTTGCLTSPETPDLGGLYDRAAQHHDERRNPIIVIPGILGSKLKQTGTDRVVWGAFAGDYADPRKPDGARLVAIPMQEGVPLSELRDDVVPAGALDRLRVELLGLPVELNAYVNILGTLGVGGYRDEELGLAGAIDYGDDHYTCFQFDYDWRRDNVENARRLHEFILEKRAYVQSEMERRYGTRNADVKFDIVAHSMGGLITRYFLRYGNQDLPADGSLPQLTWAGARHIDQAILVATPSAGSAMAVTQLVEGVAFAPFLPKYDAAVIGSMPAIYQLLPRPRHDAVVDAATGVSLDLYDPALWERLGWGLAGARQDDALQRLMPDVPDAATRRNVALDHLRKCLRRARQFAAAIDEEPATMPPVDLYLLAGDAIPTAAVIAVDPVTGDVRVGEKGPGDGTVLRSSALMDERLDGAWQPRLRSPVKWSSVNFIFKDHLALTKDEVFTDNVLYILLEQPRPVGTP